MEGRESDFPLILDSELLTLNISVVKFLSNVANSVERKVLHKTTPISRTTIN